MNVEKAKMTSAVRAEKPDESSMEIIRLPSMPVSDAVMAVYIVTAVDLTRSLRILER